MRKRFLSAFVLTFVLTGVLVLLTLGITDLKKEKTTMPYTPLTCDHFVAIDNVMLVCSDGYKYKRI
jgi:glycerol uptake facilitator-like aquaporin